MAKKNDEFSYMDAQKRLEKILVDMENGKTSVDELEAKLTEAKLLLVQSQKKLAQIEKILVQWD